MRSVYLENDASKKAFWFKPSRRDFLPEMAKFVALIRIYLELGTTFWTV